MDIRLDKEMFVFTPEPGANEGAAMVASLQNRLIEAASGRDNLSAANATILTYYFRTINKQPPGEREEINCQPEHVKILVEALTYEHSAILSPEMHALATRLGQMINEETQVILFNQTVPDGPPPVIL